MRELSVGIVDGEIDEMCEEGFRGSRWFARDRAGETPDAADYLAPAPVAPTTP